VARALAAAVAELNLATPAARDALHALIEAQAYRLAYWRVAADEINYRRFFDINDLAAVRMERDDVFEATQSFALDLAAAGKVDGLRIDHPDGLYDPARYFEKLQQGYARRAGLVLPAHDAQGRPARPLYVVAEKIAANDEEVPEGWHVHGTTGYRFANVANGVLVDTAAEETIGHAWRRFTGEVQGFHALSQAGRREVMRNALSSELNMLSSELLRIARADRRTRDYTLNALRRALADVAACMPVYRTYIIDAPSAQDERFIDEATAAAERQSSDADRSVFGFLRRALRGEAVEGAPPALAERVRRFAVRFQQFSAPVTAKGVEDTAFYRYFPLSSLNEVGGEPDRFGIEVEEFHALSTDRALRWPHTMLATSTHDNKRSEDVRNRIDVLSEMPNEWVLALTRWHGLCRDTRRQLACEDAPSRADEYLLYQTLLGTLPLRRARRGERAGLCRPHLAVHAEGRARGQAAHPLDPARRRVRGRARRLCARHRRQHGRGRLPVGHPAAGRPALVVRRVERAHAHAAEVRLAGRARPVPGQRADRAEPGRPRQPPAGGLRAAPAAARRTEAHGRAGRRRGLAAQVRALAAAPHDGRAKLWFIWRLLRCGARSPRCSARAATKGWRPRGAGAARGGLCAPA
jgi:(1->4)-alpha-D-glucan 1-alpha-D-glucosylmutase